MVDTRYGLYIAGQWQEAESGERFDAVSPYTQRAWASHAVAGPADVAAAVRAAEAAHDGEWGSLNGYHRGRLLERLAALVERDAEELAVMESTDNGKVIRETRAQMQGVARQMRYFAGLADKLTGESIPVDRPGILDVTQRVPVRVAALVTAWNSPLSLLSSKLAPALAAGAAVVIKPSEHASATTMQLCRLVEEAGIPAGVVNAVTGFAETGQSLVASKGLGRVSFTGSPGVGAHIAATAGANLVPVTLELGGKSANIVLDDADLDRAVTGAVAGIFAASGQTCVAGSRLLVHRSLHDEMIERVVDRARTVVVGDPLSDDTEMGCVANQPQLTKILGMIDRATEEGARLVIGGRPAAGPEVGDGLFVEPTVFADVTPQMHIAQEEVFGPVLSVIPFDDDEEAVAIANGTRYGLAGGVWTNDVTRALRVSQALEVGTVWVNAYRVAAVQAPSGGVKDSGFGRERSVHAVDDYLTVKNTMIDYSGVTRDPFQIAL